MAIPEQGAQPRREGYFARRRRLRVERRDTRAVEREARRRDVEQFGPSAGATAIVPPTDFIYMEALGIRDPDR